MKPAVVILTILALAAAVGYGSTRAATKTVTVTRKSPTARSQQIAQFGYIKSLTRKGSGFELRFDPAWFVSGQTANTAAAEDGAVDAGQPVPNDNYVVDESDRVLTYLVPDTARVTILTRDSTAPLYETTSTVAELERIVNGGDHRPLFEPLDSGVWIRVHNDTVCTLDQQYRP